MEGFLARAMQAARSASRLRDDGDFDAACNRAYYAMFFAIRALYGAEGVAGLGKTHASLLRAFSQDYVLGGKASRELGRALSLGQTLRSKADYSAESASREDADAAIAAMNDLLAFVRHAIGGQQEEPKS
jgi:uncharacterized protein (UPF0332 family)